MQKNPKIISKVRKERCFTPKKVFTTWNKNKMAYGSCRSCPVATPDKGNMVTLIMYHSCSSREQRQDGKGTSMDSVSHPLAKNNEKSITNSVKASCPI